MNLKIKYLLVIMVSLLTIESYTQVWHSRLPQNKSVDSLSLYEYHKAFNEYWEPFNLDGGYYINANGD